MKQNIISYEDVKKLLGHPIIETFITEDQYDVIKEVAEKKAETYINEYIIEELRSLLGKFRS